MVSSYLSTTQPAAQTNTGSGGGSTTQKTGGSGGGSGGGTTQKQQQPSGGGVDQAILDLSKQLKEAAHEADGGRLEGFNGGGLQDGSKLESGNHNYHDGLTVG